MQAEEKMTGTVIYFKADKDFNSSRRRAAAPTCSSTSITVPSPSNQLRQGRRVRYNVRESSRKPGQFEAVAVEMV